MNKLEYARYLETDHWLKVRSEALTNANHHCQLCYSTDKLCVHHNNYNNLYKETILDLIVLCRKCHEKHHDIINEDIVETCIIHDTTTCNTTIEYDLPNDIKNLSSLEIFLYKHKDENFIRKVLLNILKPKDKIEFNRIIRNSNNILVYYKHKKGNVVRYSSSKKSKDDTTQITELIKWCPEKRYLNICSSILCETLLKLILQFELDKNIDGFSIAELHRRLVEYCGIMSKKVVMHGLDKMLQKGIITEPINGGGNTKLYKIIRRLNNE